MAPVQPARRDYKGWQNPLIYALSMLVLGVIVAFIGNKVFGDKTIADIGTVTALIGVCLIGMKGIQLIVAQSKQLPAPGTSQKREPASNPPPKMLAAEPPSVTENTTRNLDATP